EDEEGAEGGARGGGVDGKSSSQTRRPSQSGKSRGPSGESRRGSAESTSDQRQRQGGTQRRRSSRPSTQMETRRASGDSGGLSKRRGVPPMGPIPSMTDAALKDLIETSLNEEKTARAPLLRTSTSPNPAPLKLVLMGRVLIPSSKGTSMPTGSNGRDKPRASRSRVHSVCIVMEDRTSSAGSYWSGSVRDITVHPGPEGREVAEKTVVTNRGWNIKGLSGVEKRDGTRETEGAAFTLTFETGRRYGAECFRL
ncbi:unnamed protein product, partial [Ectocarpus sp. 4 AP-2014]